MTTQRMPTRPLEAGRACDWRELLAAIHHAKQAGFNRQLPDRIVRRLDPQGVSTFSFFMLHEHIDGEPVEHPHVRATAHIKLKGNKAAHELPLDIPMASWRRWRTLDEYKAQREAKAKRGF